LNRPPQVAANLAFGGEVSTAESGLSLHPFQRVKMSLFSREFSVQIFAYKVVRPKHLFCANLSPRTFPRAREPWLWQGSKKPGLCWSGLFGRCPAEAGSGLLLAS
jgi:hypothetical protein